MISNERPSPFGRQLFPQPYPALPPRPAVREDTLKTGAVQIERKTFILTLKENLRGRFLRITEQANGKKNSIIIPSTGLDEFKKLTDEMAKAAKDMPARHGPASS